MLPMSKMIKQLGRTRLSGLFSMIIRIVSFYLIPYFMTINSPIGSLFPHVLRVIWQNDKTISELNVGRKSVSKSTRTIFETQKRLHSQRHHRATLPISISISKCKTRNLPTMLRATTTCTKSISVFFTRINSSINIMPKILSRQWFAGLISDLLSTWLVTTD